MPRKATPESFWSRVFKGAQADCWEWSGARDPYGYGRVSYHMDVWFSHRLAYMLTHGFIPEGKLIRHTCDNPPCCNPAHLLVGTDLDNMTDMWERKRGKPPANRGEANGSAKLSAIQVLEIRARAALGETPTALAREFGISQPVCRHVVIRKTWKHI